MGMVTRLCAICGVERETPEPLFDGMDRAPDDFAAAIDTAVAARNAGWSPREVIAHMADSEIGFGARIRMILTEETPVIASYDEERWARAFFYPERDPAVALATFRAVRASNLEILRRADEQACSRRYRQDGATRTLGELVQHRADHDLQHVRQILRA